MIAFLRPCIGANLTVFSARNRFFSKVLILPFSRGIFSNDSHSETELVVTELKDRT
jgi:hypothetical protein